MVRERYRLARLALVFRSEVGLRRLGKGRIAISQKLTLHSSCTILKSNFENLRKNLAASVSTAKAMYESGHNCLR